MVTRLTSILAALGGVVLGAGSAVIGKLAPNTASTYIGDVVLQAGSAAIGKLAANAGVNIGQVDLAATPTGNLATIAGAITAARMAVDLATTPTANLATIAGAITAARMQVDLTSTINTHVAKLTDIEVNQRPPSGGPKFGQHQSIVSGSSVTFASKALTRGCCVTNLDTTINLLISIGTPGASDVDTTIVKPGRTSAFIPCTNANAFNMRSASGTIAACYEGA